MRIILYDRDRLFAESFAHLLVTLRHDVWLVASPEEAVEAVAAEPTSVCLLEVGLGDQRALAAIHAVRSAHPETRVGVLCGIEDPRLLELVGSAGVTVVISKEHGLDGASVTLAQLMIDPQWGVPAHFSDIAAVRTTRSPRRGMSDLTPREREALRLLSLGYSTNALALSLGVSYATARTHVHNVLAKLKVHSRLEAVALFHRQEGVARFRQVRLEPAETVEPTRAHEGRIAL